jgi:hypothetical protein
MENPSFDELKAAVRALDYIQRYGNQIALDGWIQSAIEEHRAENKFSRGIRAKCLGDKLARLVHVPRSDCEAAAEAALDTSLPQHLCTAIREFARAVYREQNGEAE